MRWEQITTHSSEIHSGYTVDVISRKLHSWLKGFEKKGYEFVSAQTFEGGTVMILRRPQEVGSLRDLHRRVSFDALESGNAGTLEFLVAYRRKMQELAVTEMAACGASQEEIDDFLANEIS